jgi:hypothetical protein
MSGGAIQPIDLGRRWELIGSRFVDKNNVACVGVFSKHKTEASPGSVAEPQFEIRVYGLAALSHAGRNDFAAGWCARRRNAVRGAGRHTGKGSVPRPQL